MTKQFTRDLLATNRHHIPTVLIHPCSQLSEQPFIPLLMVHLGHLVAKHKERPDSIEEKLNARNFDSNTAARTWRI